MNAFFGTFIGYMYFHVASCFRVLFAGKKKIVRLFFPPRQYRVILRKNSRSFYFENLKMFVLNAYNCEKRNEIQENGLIS